MNAFLRAFCALIICATCARAADELSAAAETPDTPNAIWAPAATTNFDPANRPVEEAITYVVIHDIEGSAQSAIATFQDPKRGASSHYVVNSSQIWQMVKERDVAWHAGNREINHHSVGIEHEGFAGRPGFYNALLYETSARLVREITARYNIPRDRTHIISHAEVPHPTKPGFFGGASGHTDPGPYWDWQTFMTLVRNEARLVEFQFPEVIHPGELLQASATFTNLGDESWPVFKTAKTPAPDAAPSPVPVYLGTANPANRASAFFNYKGWASPLMAGMAEKEVAPSAVGRFSWTLSGPRQLGLFNESFRLTKVPFAPMMPVGFGETISATIRVEPWDITQITKSGAAAALPLSGLWDVYASQPLNKGAAPDYQINNQVVSSNHSADEKGWIKLGRFSFNDPRKVEVKMLGEQNTLNILRFVGPFPSS